jgi:hypothetical protein
MGDPQITHLLSSDPDTGATIPLKWNTQIGQNIQNITILKIPTV